MQSLDFSNPILELIARYAINTGAMTILIFGMYYRRYRNKELATAASMLNVAAFAVLTVLSNVDFSIAAGFGLFAILALFNLRSEQLEKVEMAYFFGAIAIAVICSVLGTSLVFVILTAAFVLVGAWILDHPKVLKSSSSARLVLDKIDPQILSNTEQMRSQLSEMLDVNVMKFQIVEVNYVNDLAQVRIYYRE